MTQVSDFNYELPEELIAQQPPERRGDARMLVVSREAGTFSDDAFSAFPRYLRPGDCLVLNDTRVFPARLHGVRDTSGAQIEVFLVRALNEDETEWRALVKPGKRVRRGDRIVFTEALSAEVLEHGEYGERVIRFRSSQPVAMLLEKIGQTPLPPYIHRQPQASDRDRYQTVFAQNRGSVAAPTAGLHFTPGILEQSRNVGAEIAHVTLHVGLGTFAPLRGKTVEEIQLHEEYFEVTDVEAAKMRSARRLVCVGTTSVRTVETVSLSGPLRGLKGETNLFIHPGFRFRSTGALLTNFHLPQSSLLMLVCAYGGQKLILDAYRHAVAERYRFFSYGDCMLVL